MNGNLYLLSKTTIYCSHKCWIFWSTRPSPRTNAFLTTVGWTETYSTVEYNKLLSLKVNTIQLRGQRKYLLGQALIFLFMVYFSTPPSISFFAFFFFILFVQNHSDDVRTMVPYSFFDLFMVKWGNGLSFLSTSDGVQ